ncbi:hypothetical protein [Jiella marina]|uniref:hypothetical protein n=1 Tax=Jiella sp. LLJ827 TaxID=2917712 RepID=UPI0021011B3A|nr:hypothetical protein [Jiella sp. LLJ827]MCQ0987548.1 hypothetical protein [Jiella sp. LLJ827]
MGLAPEQVDRLSLWQFQACHDGFRRAHMSEKERSQEMSEDEFDAIGAMLDRVSTVQSA